MIDALPPDLEQFIADELASREYPSRSDLIVDAVRRLRDRKARLEKLRAELQVGRDQLDGGEGIVLKDENDLERFFDDIRQRGEARYNAGRRAS